jgi:quercetin dioxygenase-like cupin family protein
VRRLRLRKKISLKELGRHTGLSAALLSKLERQLAEFRPGSGATRVHAHRAAEFLYIITGDLNVQVDGIDHRLGHGDSVYINPSVPHGYARHGSATCTALVVTTTAPG